MTISSSLDRRLVPGMSDPGGWSVASLKGAAASRPDATAHLGLRTRSSIPADALALSATNDRRLAASLEAHITRLGEENIGDIDALFDAVIQRPTVAAGLALLWSGRGEPTLSAGACLYRWLSAQSILDTLPALHQRAAAQAFFLSGQHDLLRRVLPTLHELPEVVRDYLHVDLAHPNVTLGTGDDSPGQWETLMSARFVADGLAPLQVVPSGATHHLFDHLCSPITAGTVHGPEVVVTIPCFRPDETLLTSVASIVAQTYADLDIVIVDDASGPAYSDLIDAARALDPRVRVVTLARNGGSYLARRAGITASTGELITTQDADDWSHPQRIERQVTLLQEHPQAPASRSAAVRAKNDLTHQWFGYSPIRPNASSLMIRRSVAEECGPFLPVRKSADSEYAERVERLMGPIVDLDAPLAITRLRAGSLSREDFTYQWTHPERLAFRGTYRAAHRVTSRGTPFPTIEAPPSFGRDIPSADVTPADLGYCVIADFSVTPADETHRRAWLESLLVRAANGSKGLWHIERPRARTIARPEMADTWFDLVATTPEVHLITRTSPSRIRQLVVADPEALLLASAMPTVVQSQRVDVLVEPATLGLDGGMPIDLLGVSDACAQWWGVRPRWIAGPDSTVDDLTTLRTALPGVDLHPWPHGSRQR